MRRPSNMFRLVGQDSHFPQINLFGQDSPELVGHAEQHLQTNIFELVMLKPTNCQKWVGQTSPLLEWLSG